MVTFDVLYEDAVRDGDVTAHGRESTGNVKGVEGRVFSKGKVGKV